MTNSEFIARIASFAVADMQRTRIAASLTIAQAALESGWGTSGLTLKANNLFGIKGSGPAGSLALPTTEYRNGQAVQVTAQFRSYNNWGESVTDHSALITGESPGTPSCTARLLESTAKQPPARLLLQATLRTRVMRPS
ncbi:glycoside hydrolase family 73 protein [Paenibacillus rhizoplanae]